MPAKSNFSTIFCSKNWENKMGNLKLIIPRVASTKPHSTHKANTKIKYQEASTCPCEWHRGGLNFKNPGFSLFPSGHIRWSIIDPSLIHITNELITCQNKQFVTVNPDGLGQTEMFNTQKMRLYRSNKGRAATPEKVVFVLNH